MIPLKYTGSIILSFICLTAHVFAQTGIRIVSLSPSVTYNLQQMGADSCIVGRTTYCPPTERNRPNITVGNVLETNLEKILILKPDIVFSMAFTKTEVRNKLESLGIKVKDFPTPKNFKEICQQTVEIGELIGFKRQADSIVKRETLAVNKISREFLQYPPFAQKPDVFFQIGNNPIFPVLEGTFMNEYLSLLGLENIVKEYKGGGISQEYVIAASPDIMFISQMSGTGVQVLQNWKRFGSIRAVQTGRLVLVDDNEACCPSPVFFRKTLQFLANYLNSL